MEKPIIFNAEMINAILNGEKTMTRRIIKPQPSKERKFVDYSTNLGYPESTNYFWASFGIGNKSPVYFKCPYKVGMNLWVRETWCVHQRYDTIPPRILPETKYLQNGITYLADVYKDEKSLWMGSTRPSIFMPRWASRINLEIIDVRVERSQDITEADALAEGIGKRIGSSSMGHTFIGIEHFHALWDSINKKRGYEWTKNPWCWCVSFKKI